MEGVAMKTMRLVLALLVLLTPMGFRRAVAADIPAHDTPSPVLVELFTSEGCSTCPPADALLTKLDGLQPIAGAQVIVLSEHVDYWNHDGWKDVYSSSFFTDRQSEYVRRLEAKTPYTPQMVVDGATQLNGGDVGAVGRAIETARSHVKIPVRISSVSLADPKTIHVHLAVEALPADFKLKKADIFVAVALDHAESHVGAGENKGRDLRHVAVAESITKVGTVEKGKNFDRDVVVKVKAPPDMGNLRLIAFVQGSYTGDVVGAALLTPPLRIRTCFINRLQSGRAVSSGACA
jgi:hypothetical protein